MFVNQRENLTLDQESLRAFLHASMHEAPEKIFSFLSSSLKFMYDAQSKIITLNSAFHGLKEAFC